MWTMLMIKLFSHANVNWLDAFPEKPENYFGRLYDGIKVHFPEITNGVNGNYPMNCYKSLVMT